MKFKFIATIGIIGAILSSAQAELTWHTDFEEGKKAAAESGKTLLVDFTGSDWCHWCIKLKEEVFSQEAFASVSEDYVLVELDFPQGEGLITPEQRAKNEEIAQKFSVQGFPSVILFDGDRAIARTGYQAGGPEAYLNHLAEIEKPFKDLKAAEGDARKEALASFLKTIPGQEIEESFQAEFTELKKLDPEDESGFIAEMASAKAMAKFEDVVEQNLASGEFDTVLTEVESFLAEYNPEGEQRQHVLMARVMVYVEQGEKDKAFSQLDAMAALAPESQLSQHLAEIKENIEGHLEMKSKIEDEEEAEKEAASESAEPTVVEEAEKAEKAGE